jgi:hypothetical protein
MHLKDGRLGVDEDTLDESVKLVAEDSHRRSTLSASRDVKGGPATRNSQAQQNVPCLP